MNPIGHKSALFQPNLPEHQRFIQWLAEQFNTDERLWKSLEPLRKLRRKLHPCMSSKKRKQLDLLYFANSQPPKDCLSIWRTS